MMYERKYLHGGKRFRYTKEDMYKEIYKLYSDTGVSPKGRLVAQVQECYIEVTKTESGLQCMVFCWGKWE